MKNNLYKTLIMLMAIFVTIISISVQIIRNNNFNIDNIVSNVGKNILTSSQSYSSSSSGGRPPYCKKEREYYNTNFELGPSHSEPEIIRWGRETCDSFNQMRTVAGCTFGVSKKEDPNNPGITEYYLTVKIVNWREFMRCFY